MRDLLHEGAAVPSALDRTNLVSGLRLTSSAEMRNFWCSAEKPSAGRRVTDVAKYSSDELQ